MKKTINKQGFTLIEILGVLLIFSTLVLVIVPNMTRALNAISLEATANKLAKDISRAKMLAIMYKRDVFINFHEVKEGKSFYEITFPSSSERITIPREISFNHLPLHNILRFNQHGNPLPGDTIHLLNSRGKSLYVIIARSGRVRVSHFKPGGN